MRNQTSPPILFCLADQSADKSITQRLLKQQQKTSPIAIRHIGFNCEYATDHQGKTIKGKQTQQSNLSRLDLAIQLVLNTIENRQPIGMIIQLNSTPHPQWKSVARELSLRYERSPFSRTVILGQSGDRETASQIIKNAGFIFAPKQYKEALLCTQEQLHNLSFRCTFCSANIAYIKPKALDEELQCPRCNSKIKHPARIKVKDKVVILHHDTELLTSLFEDQAYNNQPVARVTPHPSRKNTWGIKNLTTETWSYVKGDISGHVAPGKSLIIQDRISLTMKGVVCKIRAPNQRPTGIKQSVTPTSISEYISHQSYAKYKSGCSGCGESLGSRYIRLVDVDNVNICLSCSRSPYECDFCGISTRMNTYTYPDGRISCAHCRGFALTDHAELEVIHLQARSFIEQKLQLPLSPTKEYYIKLSSAAEIAKELSKVFVPTDKFDSRETGFFRWRVKQRAPVAIYIEDGVTTNQGYGTMVHELAHLWQVKHFASMSNGFWVEGFAQWVKYKALKHCGALDELHKIENNSSPTYGDGFREIRKIEQQYGSHRVIDIVLQRVEQET